MKSIYTNYFNFKLAKCLNHRYANSHTSFGFWVFFFLFFVFKEKKGCSYYNLNLELTNALFILELGRRRTTEKVKKRK